MDTPFAFPIKWATKPVLLYHETDETHWYSWYTFEPKIALKYPKKPLFKPI
jgi:hypothetical protein